VDFPNFETQMNEQEKLAILRKLDRRERILKGQLNFFVRHRHEIPEGVKYADERIDGALDELRAIWKWKAENGL
jgi:hypothetical protein